MVSAKLTKDIILKSLQQSYQFDNLAKQNDRQFALNSTQIA